MSRREAERLADIRNAIAAIRDHIDSGAFDRKTADAVLYNLCDRGGCLSGLGGNQSRCA